MLNIKINNDPTSDNANATFNSEQDLINFLEERWCFDYGMFVDNYKESFEVRSASELLDALKKFKKLQIDFDDCFGTIELKEI